MANFHFGKTNGRVENAIRKAERRRGTWPNKSERFLVVENVTTSNKVGQIRGENCNGNGLLKEEDVDSSYLIIS